MALPRQVTDPEISRLINEAAALHRAGNLAAAEAAYGGVLKKRPRDPDALHLLGVILGQKGDLHGGLASIERALAVRDDFPDAHTNAALIATRAGKMDRAEDHLRRAIHYRPFAASHCALGNFLRSMGKHEEALAAFRAALVCEPNNFESYIIYARALRMSNDFQAMLAVVQSGLKIAPDHPTLHLLASEAEFGLGRLRDGWQAYRWRFRSIENRVTAKPYSLPLWQGEDLTNRAILIWGEQGIGDEVMYGGMFADVLAAAGRCVLQCSPRLAPLWRRSFPAAAIFDRDLTAEELAGIDFQTPAGSLGEWLRPTFDTFPVRGGYLLADPDLTSALRRKYAGEAQDRILVGIAWRSMNAESAAEKSLNLLEWGPILNVPGIVFVNLQYGDCAVEIGDARKGFGANIIHDPAIEPLRDMDGYAAQVAAMDVVVSSSGTAAHVAAALGVPVLCLLPASLGRGRRWYWFAEQGKCPWYPSLRVFVQRRPEEWLDVIRDAGLALLDFAAARGLGVAPYLRAMASAFRGMGRLADAEILYRRLQREPDHAAEALSHIAGLREAANDADGALAAYAAARAHDPTMWQAHNDAGALLARLNRFEDAITLYRQGLEHKATSAELHNNLGTSLYRLGRAAEARNHYEQAMQFAGTGSRIADTIALNYAGALYDSTNPARALEILGGLIERDPDYVDAHYNRARMLLSLGEFPEGWREMAWRLKRPSANVRYDSFPKIRPWASESLSGKNVLIWTEQGIGDEIFLATMIPDAIAAAKHVTVLCSERLVPLFRRSFPQAIVDQRKVPLPKSATDPGIDFQMSLADLGAAFRQRFEDFPKRSHVLVPDAKRTTALRAKYQSLRPGVPLVGISWSSQRGRQIGNLEMGWLKSNNLLAWRAILQTPGVAFVNLQYGDCDDELAAVREQLGADVLQDREIDPLKDMDAFAAQVAAMDLVISTSNSTVHAAGAVGTAAWVLLPEGRGRHWYWFRDRSDCPWYPSVRFIPQDRAGDWSAAIALCAADLANWAYAKGRNA